MVELTSLLASIRRQHRFASVLFAALLCLGAVGVLLLPRTYVTSSQVLVKRPDIAQQSTEYPQIQALLAWNHDTTMETYIALAQQPAIAEHVIRDLGLRATAQELLAKNVVVTPLTNADIIDISVDWPDAQGSAAVANAFARAFIARQRALAASEASEAANSLASALNNARVGLANSERELTLFESRHELTDATSQTGSILAAINDIQSKERTLEAERVQAEAQLSNLTSQLAAAPSTMVASKVISSAPNTDQVEQQLSQQQLQLRLLRQEFTEKYPDVIATEKQIASLKSTLAAMPRTKVASRSVEPNPLSLSLVNQSSSLRVQIAGDAAQLATLRSQEATLLGNLRVFPEDASALSELQRHVKADQDMYDALQSNYFNAVVAQNMAVSDLTLVRRADPVFADVRPARRVAFLIVSLIALLVTLASAALVDWSFETFGREKRPISAAATD